MARRAEEEFRRLTLEIRFLEENAQALQSRVNMVNAAITDLTIANMTLEGMEKGDEGSQLFVPIGGSSYIKASLQDPDRIIVGVGAGVSVEKSLKDAKETVQKRLESLEKTRTSLQQRFSQVAQKMNEDRGRLEELAAELSRENASKNV